MNRPPFNACFFDLDGTLVDSEIIWVQSVHGALEERDCSISEAEAEDLVYGRSWRDIFSTIQKNWPGTYKDIEEMTPVTERIYQRLASASNILIPGSMECLRETAKHVPVAIVSGSTNDTIQRFIDEHDLGEVVAFHLGCESYSPGKPHPAPYEMAAKQAGVSPENCLVYEDSTVGVASAKAAGMYCIAIARPDRPAQDVAAADEIVETLPMVCG